MAFLEVKRYTGEYYIKLKLFGGYNIYAEAECTYISEHDFTESPIFYRYLKLVFEDVAKLKLKIDND